MYFYIWKFFSSLETCDTSASNFCKEGIFGYFQEGSTSGMHNPSTCERERVNRRKYNSHKMPSRKLSSYKCCFMVRLVERQFYSFLERTSCTTYEKGYRAL